MHSDSACTLLQLLGIFLHLILAGHSGWGYRMHVCGWGYRMHVLHVSKVHPQVRLWHQAQEKCKIIPLTSTGF